MNTTLFSQIFHAQNLLKIQRKMALKHLNVSSFCELLIPPLISTAGCTHAGSCLVMMDGQQLGTLYVVVNII